MMMAVSTILWSSRNSDELLTVYIAAAAWVIVL